jgi:hypothetical protein
MYEVALLLNCMPQSEAVPSVSAILAGCRILLVAQKSSHIRMVRPKRALAPKTEIRCSLDIILGKSLAVNTSVVGKSRGLDGYQTGRSRTLEKVLLIEGGKGILCHRRQLPSSRAYSSQIGLFFIEVNVLGNREILG